MFDSNRGGRAEPVTASGQALAWGRQEWVTLLLLLAFAAFIRIIFFNGLFGSDDTTYLSRSNEIAQGIWSSADYNGALRYGYNIPAALFIWMFGLSTFSANLWSLLCSLAEIAAVFWLVSRYLGLRTATYAGLIVATLPLHIALATRIHADPVLSCFLTLSFVLLYTGERSQRSAVFFTAGLSMGMVFWVKELAAVTLFAIATYPLFVRRFDPRWLWICAGGLVALGAHLLLMQIIAGDPLHLIATVTGQVQRSFVGGRQGEDSIGYYFWYLFVNIKHSWLIGYLALIGILMLFWRRPLSSTRGSDIIAYSAWWLIALLAFLTFFPVSLDPLRFAMKQSNYLNLFFAPMAILGAYVLSRVPGHWLRRGLLSLVLVGGAALGALEQADYRGFTANSRAAVEFARSHPDDWVLGSVNNASFAGVNAILDQDTGLSARFAALKESSQLIRQLLPQTTASPIGFVVVDRQTQNWGKGAVPVRHPPSCWTPVQDLAPTGFGLSKQLAELGLSIVDSVLPDALAQRINAPLRALIEPAIATVYQVDINNLWCEGG